MLGQNINDIIVGGHAIVGKITHIISSVAGRACPEDDMFAGHPPVDILAQHGIIGLIFCLWFFVALAWQGYKLCLRLEGRGDFVEALANIAFAGTIGCIVMMVFGDWLFPFVYTQTIAGFDYIVYSWLFMGTIVALDYITRNEVEVADKPQLG